jgi:hypothetical protein
VGSEKEESLASVRCPDFLSRERSCRNAETCSVQVGDDSLEPSRPVAWNVLAEQERCLAFLHNAQDVWPQMPRIALCKTSPGDRERLARVARSDEIHASAKSRAIKGREIVPDRRRIQRRILHPRHEHGRGEGFPFDVANSSHVIAEREPNTEVQSTDARAEAEGE